jgi:hypothetical protein
MEVDDENFTKSPKHCGAGYPGDGVTAMAFGAGKPVQLFLWLQEGTQLRHQFLYPSVR